MMRFYSASKTPVMVQYEKAMISNSAFRKDLVCFYYDVLEKHRTRETERGKWVE
jgi:hypothetical protein